MNALGGVAAVGLGVGIGAFAGMPIGVINMAIVHAASAGRRRFAGGLGVGGATADAIHAGLAFAGVGHLVTADPRVVRGLAIAAAVMIVAYGVVAWRFRRASSPRVPEHTQLGRGIASGVALTLPNPGALGAWVAVAAAVWPDATLGEAALIAGGVLAGSALWFTLLARWISRVRPDHPAIAIVPRVALLVLIAIAVAGVVRAL